LRFFHQLGIFLHFTELSDYVIVNHQWFYNQLSNIFGFSSANIVAHKPRKDFETQGILSAKDLDAVDIEGDLKITSFIELLCNKKIMAKYKKQGEDYFYMPYFLPYSQPHEDKYKFLLFEPLLVRLAFGSCTCLPRGFFSCLVVHLLQAPPEQWELLHNKSEKRFRDIVSFMYNEKYCVRLYDKTKYLEVQIRDYKYSPKEAIFPIFASLYQCMLKVCTEWGLKELKLEYGFICHHSKNNNNHMIVARSLALSIEDPEPCSLKNTAFCKQCEDHTDIGKLHKMWFGQSCIM